MSKYLRASWSTAKAIGDVTTVLCSRRGGRIKRGGKKRRIIVQGKLKIGIVTLLTDQNVTCVS